MKTTIILREKKLIDNDMDLLGAIRGDFGPFLGVFGGFF